MTPEEMTKAQEAVMAWWGPQRAAGRVVSEGRLEGAAAAKTVRKRPDGRVTVTVPERHRDPTRRREPRLTNTAQAIEQAFREEAGRVSARLTRLLGDFDLAEDLVQEAIISAMEHWPRDGIPEVPAAWLLTVARRKGIDRLRREARYRQKLAVLEEVLCGR